MPDTELDQWGAVLGCEGACCMVLRPTTTMATITDRFITQGELVTSAPIAGADLTTCPTCNTLYGEGVRCACRPCIYCDTIYASSVQMMCSTCLTNRRACNNCGDSYLSTDLQSCRCRVSGLCRDCIRYYHNQCNNPVAIHPYNYKPPALFSGDGPLYLGVELEVDRGRKNKVSHSWEENPRNILDPLGVLSQDNSLFYLKRDGSLRAGFELVTHPCSLSYHQASFPWPEVLEELRRVGLQSHNTETCGLHIHASRKGFGRTRKRQEVVLGRLVMLWNRHWWRYAQMSRRRVVELRWCAPNREAADVVEEDMVEMLEQVKKPGDRAVAINTLPWDQEDSRKETVEFRLFKGTLNHTSLMAALEIVHHSITLCQSAEWPKVIKGKWSGVVEDAEEREYTYLTEYVKERGVE